MRLIMECQNRTISRGSRSIFSRLRKEGIDVSHRDRVLPLDSRVRALIPAVVLRAPAGLELTAYQPEEYITFFSLRGWGKFKSGVLTTEQVYIHGKTCIIDDRE